MRTEEHVIRLRKSGLKNIEIAQKLGISPSWSSLLKRRALGLKKEKQRYFSPEFKEKVMKEYRNINTWGGVGELARKYKISHHHFCDWKRHTDDRRLKTSKNSRNLLVGGYWIKLNYDNLRRLGIRQKKNLRYTVSVEKPNKIIIRLY